MATSPVSCLTNSDNPDCECPAHTTRTIIQANEFGPNNPRTTRYFCSMSGPSCRRNEPGHSSCYCYSSSTYKDCTCPSPGKKFFIPYGVIPDYQRDFIFCCDDPKLGTAFADVCKKAGYPLSPPEPTRTITQATTSNQPTITTQPTSNQPTITTQPTSNQPTTNQPIITQSTSNQLTSNQPSNQLTSNQPAITQRTSNQPSNLSTITQPTSNQPTSNQPSNLATIRQTTSNQPTSNQPSNQPISNQPTVSNQSEEEPEQIQPEQSNSGLIVIASIISLLTIIIIVTIFFAFNS